MAKQIENCVRCDCKITQETGVVRAVCSNCDLALATMHHVLEYKLFGRIVYMPDCAEVAWFKTHPDYADAIHKAREPAWRSWYRIPNNDKARSAKHDKSGKVKSVEPRGANPPHVSHDDQSEPVEQSCPT